MGKPMIRVRLAGGLGNQLFQLAAATALSMRSDMRVQILTAGLRDYKTARQPDIIRLVDLDSLNVEHGLTHSLIGWASVSARAGRFLPILGINDRNFADTLELHRIGNRPFMLDGYFQHQWRWDQLFPIAMLLRDAMFSRWKTVRKPDADCVVHVRGGDFLRSREHQIVNERYYAEALSALRDRYNVERVLVVTDDSVHANRVLECARTAHPKIEFRLADRASDPLEDFATLVRGPRRVIGNSTFSWWASTLDPQHGTTVSPNRFVRDQLRHAVAPWELTLSTA
jgi:hypothetical protein